MTNYIFILMTIFLAVFLATFILWTLAFIQSFTKIHFSQNHSASEPLQPSLAENSPEKLSENLTQNSQNIAIIGLISSFCFGFFALPFSGFQYLGVCITLLFIILFALLNRKPGNYFDVFLISTACLSAISFVLRTDLIVLVSQAALFIYAISLYLLNFPKKASILQLFSAPIVLLALILKSKNRYKINFDLSKPAQFFKNQITNQQKNEQKISFPKAIFTIFFTILIMALILPILASVNPQFAGWINNLFNTPNNFISWIFSGNIFEYILRAIFTYVFWFLISRVKNLSLAIFPEQKEVKIPFYMLFTQSIVAIFVGMFLISQGGVYLSNLNITQEIFGFTVSQKVNEIFFQLSYVVFILFNVILLDFKQSKLHKILAGVLLFESLAMLMVAIYSNLQYVEKLGLTQARLYGFLTVFLLTLVGFLLLKRRFFAFKIYSFLRGFFVVFCITIAIPTLIPFDFVIHQYNSKIGQEVAQYAPYFNQQTFSYDSYIFGEIYEGYKSYRALITENKNKDFACKPIASGCVGAYELWYQREYLIKKYANLSQPTQFNLAEFVSYLQVRGQ